MTVLGFEREARMCEGRRVRSARFERRSSLPVSAACLVANGVREMLGAVLGAPVSLRLVEPAIPDPAAWRAISAGAHLFGVRGSVSDAAFVLRPRDALALAAAAFGETPEQERELSPLEREVLMRALRAVSGALAPVSGRDPAPLERILDITGYATYFELIVERPACARIGVALSREPAGRSGATLRLEDLLDVEIETAVQFASGCLPAGAFLDLGPGAHVPMMTRVGERGSLVAGGVVLARGECGALGERHAMIVGAASKKVN